MSKEIIEMVDKSRENFLKAESLLWTIQSQADFFEMRTGMKPTIFMSLDLLHILTTGLEDVVVHRIDKNQTTTTVCGYDTELIAHSKEVLYVGYRILF